MESVVDPLFAVFERHARVAVETAGACEDALLVAAASQSLGAELDHALRTLTALTDTGASAALGHVVRWRQATLRSLTGGLIVPGGTAVAATTPGRADPAREAAVNVVFCRTVLGLLQTNGRSPDWLPPSLCDALETISLAHLIAHERAASAGVTGSGNVVASIGLPESAASAVAELFSDVLALLSQRFNRFLEVLQKLAPEVARRAVVKGTDTAAQQAKRELLVYVRTLRYLRFPARAALRDAARDVQIVKLLHSVAVNLHRHRELKQSLCEVVSRLFPRCACLGFAVETSPGDADYDWNIFVQALHAKVLRWARKPKYYQQTYPAQTALICVSTRAFFDRSVPVLLDALLSRLRERREAHLRAMALQCLVHLLGVQLGLPRNALNAGASIGSPLRLSRAANAGNQSPSPLPPLQPLPQTLEADQLAQGRVTPTQTEELGLLSFPSPSPPHLTLWRETAWQSAALHGLFGSPLAGSPRSEPYDSPPSPEYRPAPLGPGYPLLADTLASTGRRQRANTAPPGLSPFAGVAGTPSAGAVAVVDRRMLQRVRKDFTALVRHTPLQLASNLPLYACKVDFMLLLCRADAEFGVDLLVELLTAETANGQRSPEAFTEGLFIGLTALLVLCEAVHGEESDVCATLAKQLPPLLLSPFSSLPAKSATTAAPVPRLETSAFMRTMQRCQAEISRCLGNILQLCDAFLNSSRTLAALKERERDRVACIAVYRAALSCAAFVLPGAFSTEEYVSLLCRLTIHSERELREASCSTLLRIARLHSPLRPAVIHGLAEFVGQLEETDLVIEESSRRLCKALNIWVAVSGSGVLGSPSHAETGAGETILFGSLKDMPPPALDLTRVEGLLLGMLCSRSAAVRTSALQALQLLRLIVVSTTPVTAATPVPPTTVADLLDVSYHLLAAHAEAAGAHESTTKVASPRRSPVVDELETLPEMPPFVSLLSQQCAPPRIWFVVLGAVVTALLPRCTGSVRAALPAVIARLSALSSRLQSAKDELATEDRPRMESWRNLVMFYCTACPASPVQQQQAQQPKPSAAAALRSTGDTFANLVGFLRSAVVEFAETVSTAFGCVDVGYVWQVMDAMKIIEDELRQVSTGKDKVRRSKVQLRAHVVRVYNRLVLRCTTLRDFSRQVPHSQTTLRRRFIDVFDEHIEYLASSVEIRNTAESAALLRMRFDLAEAVAHLASTLHTHTPPGTSPAHPCDGLDMQRRRAWLCSFLRPYRPEPAAAIASAMADVAKTGTRVWSRSPVANAAGVGETEEQQLPSYLVAAYARAVAALLKGPLIPSGGAILRFCADLKRRFTLGPKGAVQHTYEGNLSAASAKLISQPLTPTALCLEHVLLWLQDIVQYTGSAVTDIFLGTLHEDEARGAHAAQAALHVQCVRNVLECNAEFLSVVIEQAYHPHPAVAAVYFMALADVLCGDGPGLWYPEKLDLLRALALAMQQCGNTAAPVRHAAYELADLLQTKLGFKGLDGQHQLQLFSAAAPHWHQFQRAVCGEIAAVHANHSVATLILYEVRAHIDAFVRESDQLALLSLLPPWVTHVDWRQGLPMSAAFGAYFASYGGVRPTRHNPFPCSPAFEALFSLTERFEARFPSVFREIFTLLSPVGLLVNSLVSVVCNKADVSHPTAHSIVSHLCRCDSRQVFDTLARELLDERQTHLFADVPGTPSKSRGSLTLPKEAKLVPHKALGVGPLRLHAALSFLATVLAELPLAEEEHGKRLPVLLHTAFLHLEYPEKSIAAAAASLILAIATVVTASEKDATAAASGIDVLRLLLKNPGVAELGLLADQLRQLLQTHNVFQLWCDEVLLWCCRCADIRFRLLSHHIFRVLVHHQPVLSRVTAVTSLLQSSISCFHALQQQFPPPSQVRGPMGSPTATSASPQKSGYPSPTKRSAVIFSLSPCYPPFAASPVYQMYMAAFVEALASVQVVVTTLKSETNLLVPEALWASVAFLFCNDISLYRAALQVLFAYISRLESSRGTAILGLMRPLAGAMDGVLPLLLRSLYVKILPDSFFDLVAGTILRIVVLRRVPDLRVEAHMFMIVAAFLPLLVSFPFPPPSSVQQLALQLQAVAEGAGWMHIADILYGHATGRFSSCEQFLLDLSDPFCRLLFQRKSQVAHLLLFFNEVLQRAHEHHLRGLLLVVRWCLLTPRLSDYPQSAVAFAIPWLHLLCSRLVKMLATTEGQFIAPFATAVINAVMTSQYPPLSTAVQQSPTPRPCAALNYINDHVKVLTRRGCHHHCQRLVERLTDCANGSHNFLRQPSVPRDRKLLRNPRRWAKELASLPLRRSVAQASVINLPVLEALEGAAATSDAADATAKALAVIKRAAEHGRTASRDTLSDGIAEEYEERVGEEVGRDAYTTEEEDGAGASPSHSPRPSTTTSEPTLEAFHTGVEEELPSLVIHADEVRGEESDDDDEASGDEAHPGASGSSVRRDSSP
eukprot:TRINITY_DN14426_c0_g1_i2.p1 TRINITY_DN14426_c0_g1~~TRINITY_DN14426_c0_g1_i2.p1  ORF type:complete len:2447 (+),score=336.10 TRINITY_DN14426_c0_g1_i2:21-7361(+)